MIAWESSQRPKATVRASRRIADHLLSLLAVPVLLLQAASALPASQFQRPLQSK